MIAVVLVLLVLWIALAVVGFVVKGLLWLAIAALVLFVITSVYGFLRHGRGARAGR